MASMTISLLDPLRDYVRDLIRRDQGGIEDEVRWLRALDASIAESLSEMNAGGGIDLDAACDAALAELTAVGGDIHR